VTLPPMTLCSLAVVVVAGLAVTTACSSGGGAAAPDAGVDTAGVASCREIVVRPESATALTVEPPIGLWRTPAGFHVIHTAFEPAPAGKDPRSYLVVDTFDPRAGTRTARRMYEVATAQLVTTTTPVAGAPDGSFAVGAVALQRRPSGVSFDGLLIGRLDSDGPLLRVEQAGGELSGLVAWDGEAFAIHTQDTQLKLARVRPDGVVLRTGHSYGVPTELDGRQFGGGGNRVMATDPAGGRTLILTAGGGPLLLSGHARDGTPVDGQAGVPANVAGTRTSYHPAIAPVGQAAWALWGQAAATTSRPGQPMAGKVARIDAELRLLGAPIELGTWNPQASGPAAAFLATGIDATQLFVASIDRIDWVRIDASDRVERKGLVVAASGRLPTVTHLQALEWEGAPWLAIGQKLEDTRPWWSTDVLRIIRVDGDCQSPATAPE
jgi:hypothetical protein